MKKIIALVLALGMIFALCSCGGKTENPTDNTNSSDSGDSSDNTGTKTPDSLPTGVSAYGKLDATYDTMEYALYNNIFYNDTGSDYEGQKITKVGTFTMIYDAFNSKTRYYVWGFNDKTQCCDYQWEFVMSDGVEVPTPGAKIEMTGIFTKSEDALDGYWFTDAKVEVKTDFEKSEYEFDTTTMSATLARVQIANMEMFPDVFDGKTALIYGRALSTATIQHPFYDESWSMDFLNSSHTPAIGQYLLLGGKIVQSGDTACLDVTYYAEAE